MRPPASSALHPFRQRMAANASSPDLQAEPPAGRAGTWVPVVRGEVVVRAAGWSDSSVSLVFLRKSFFIMVRSAQEQAALALPWHLEFPWQRPAPVHPASALQQPAPSIVLSIRVCWREGCPDPATRPLRSISGQYACHQHHRHTLDCSELRSLLALARQKRLERAGRQADIRSCTASHSGTSRCARPQTALGQCIDAGERALAPAQDSVIWPVHSSKASAQRFHGRRARTWVGEGVCAQ